MVTGILHNACRLMVGTSGYSYMEWVDGGFYPTDTKSGRMLSFYAKTFSVTELNYTWYQIPKDGSIERMRRQVPEEFCFTAKLIRSLTHEVDSDRWREQTVQYRNCIAPPIQSGQLAAILIQFPSAFDRVPPNRYDLATLLDEFEGLPAAVEFRNASWVSDKVFAELERRRVTLVGGMSRICRGYSRYRPRFLLYSFSRPKRSGMAFRRYAAPV